MSDLQLVQATRRAADLYYNASEWTVPNMGTQGACYNLTATTSISTLGAGDSWNYQSCSEVSNTTNLVALQADSLNGSRS